MLPEIISEVSRYKKVTLGEREEEFLRLIEDGFDSSYKIFALFKKGIPMEYTNVNKRVRRLYELGLIEEAKDKPESVRKARYYTLTSEGLFYFLTSSPQGGYILKSWRKRYNHPILKYLLEPYFEEKTLDTAEDTYQIDWYLRECCRLILTCVAYLKLVSDHPLRKVAGPRLYEQLEIDLKWQAKSLAVWLLTKKADLYYAVNPFLWPKAYLTNQLKEEPKFWDKYYAQGYSRINILADKKFMSFAKSVAKEYERAFSRLTS